MDDELTARGTIGKHVNFFLTTKTSSLVKGLPVCKLLKPTTAGLVFRTLTGTTRCLENSFLCLTYIAETQDVGDGTD